MKLKTIIYVGAAMFFAAIGSITTFLCMGESSICPACIERATKQIVKVAEEEKKISNEVFESSLPVTVKTPWSLSWKNMPNEHLGKMTGRFLRLSHKFKGGRHDGLTRYQSIAIPDFVTLEDAPKYLPKQIHRYKLVEIKPDSWVGFIGIYESQTGGTLRDALFFEDTELVVPTTVPE